MKNRNTLIIIFVAIVIVGSLYYLFVRRNQLSKPDSESRTSVESTGQELRKISFANAPPKLSPVGFIIHLMQKQGIDKKHNIELDLKSVPPAEGALSLAQGAVETSPFGAISAVRANAVGNDIVLFGNSLNSNCSIVVSPTSSISSLDDLRGKKVGTFPKTSGIYTEFSTVLALEGFNVEADFEVVATQQAALLPLLEKGDLAAMFTCEPVISQLLANKSVRVLESTSRLWKKNTGKERPLILIGLAAHRDWFKTHQDDARSFRSAYYETAQHLADNLDIFDDPEIRELLGIESDEEAENLKDAYPNLLPKTWDKTDTEDIRFYLEKAQSVGLLDPEVSFDIFVLQQ